MPSILARSRRLIPHTLLLCLAMTLAGCPFLDDDPDQNDRPADNPAQNPPDDQPDDGDDQPGDRDDGDDGDRADNDGNTDDSTVCGREVLPSPAQLPAAPCQRGDSVMSESFQRTAGPPNRDSKTFHLESNSRVCLTVTNGAGGDRISAAWVYLDGDLLFGPDRFSQQVGQLRESLVLPAGDHEIRTRLASKPGASFDIDIRASGVTNMVTKQPDAVGKQGILTVSNVAVDHPMFSPNGDGYHETALFNADNNPTGLPENKKSQYSLRWDWRIIDADTCSPAGVTLSGTTPVNSPTNVQVHWDGRDDGGTIVPDGKYIYEYHVELLGAGGKVVDTVTARPRGLLVDTTTPDFGTVDFTDKCEPRQDEHECRCPDDLEDGTRCTFAWIPYLQSFEDPATVDTGKFITTHQDPTTDRWEVVVDLRDYNGGGLVPQSDGTWDSLEQLQSWVSELTGVPADAEATRLFNFDYTQLGYSTPVVEKKGAVDGFNHFLLDAITDATGKITIGGRTIDLKQQLASSDTEVPSAYRIDNPREDDEACGENGNTDGETRFQTKSCTKVKTANLDPGGTNLGIYLLVQRMFDVRIDGEGTSRDGHCIVNGIFKCGVRTVQRGADLTAAGEEFIEHGEIDLAREVETVGTDAPAVVTHTDRHFSQGGDLTPIDGVCSRSLSSVGGMSTPLDTAAGAVAPSCIVNGIF